MSKKQKKLAKYLLEKENTSWDQYLKRFQGTKPLKLRSTDIYPDRLSPSDSTWDTENPYAIGSNGYGPKKLEREYKITAGFKKRKVKKEDIEELPYLETIFTTIDFLLHRNVIDIMQKICPDDFEIMPVTLYNLRKDTEYFEITDFYNINVLRCIDAIDQESSIMEWSDYGSISFSRIRYKENPWDNGTVLLKKENNRDIYKHFKMEKSCKLAIDALTGAVIWHPDLAKELPTESYHWFITEKDQFK